MAVLGRFRITASPKPSSNSANKLDYVDFCAIHEGEDDRTWRIEPHDLMRLFDILKSKKVAFAVICDLHEGNIVTLPGEYGAKHLVELGFRGLPKEA